MAKIQSTPDYVYLYGDDNKVIKSIKVTSSHVIASAQIRTYAKRNKIEVR